MRHGYLESLYLPLTLFFSIFFLLSYERCEFTEIYIEFFIKSLCGLFVRFIHDAKTEIRATIYKDSFLFNLIREMKLCPRNNDNCNNDDDGTDVDKSDYDSPF